MRTDAATDSFLRAARTVVSSIGAELALLGDLPTSVVLAVKGRSPGPDLTVQSFTRDRDEAEVAVMLPSGFAELRADQRRVVVARALVEAVGVACGDKARGLAEAAADRAGTYAFLFRSASAWKSAPGRHHRARLVGWLADDGFARVMVEVERGDQVLISTPVTGPTTAPRLERTLESLRWRGKSAVEFATAGTRIRGFGPSMEIGGDRITLDLSELAPRIEAGEPWGPVPQRLGPSDSADRFPMTVVSLPDDAVFIDVACGPVDSPLARRYQELADGYCALFRSDASWLTWLGRAGARTIGLAVDLDPPRDSERLIAHRFEASAGVTLRRHKPLTCAEPTVARSVREDIETLIGELRELLDADQPPDLPLLEP